MIEGEQGGQTEQLCQQQIDGHLYLLLVDEEHTAKKEEGEDMNAYVPSGMKLQKLEGGAQYQQVDHGFEQAAIPPQRNDEEAGDDGQAVEDQAARWLELAQVHHIAAAYGADGHQIDKQVELGIQGDDEQQVAQGQPEQALVGDTQRRYLRGMASGEERKQRHLAKRSSG